MPRRAGDIAETIFGLVIWCGILVVIFGLVGAYKFLIGASAVGVVGIAIALALPRFAKWKKNRAECPHGVKGGLVLRLCGACVATMQREEAERQRRIEADALKERIRRSAQELQESEAQRLRRSIVPALAELRLLSPQRFEDEIAGMFERLGYVVQQTPYSNDFGRDAILMKDGEKFLVECKRYGENNTSGRPELQKFHSAIISDSAKSGFFVTTGSFSAGAKEHATKIGITLIDGEELLHYMMRSRELSSDDDKYSSMCVVCGARVLHKLRSPEVVDCSAGHPVEPTLDVDGLLGRGPKGAAPKCSKCGKPMRLVNGRRGRFWGCSQYPRCRSTRPWHPQKL